MDASSSAMGLRLSFYLLVRYVNWQFDRRLEVEQSAVDKAPIGAWLMLALALVIFLLLLKYYPALGSASAF
jgi:membrane protein required for beta-lactamase induction